jgi:hypothetical protein
VKKITTEAFPGQAHGMPGHGVAWLVTSLATGHRGKRRVMHYPVNPDNLMFNTFSVHKIITLRKAGRAGK